jgi:CRP/FNR family transcriptional regulator
MEKGNPTPQINQAIILQQTSFPREVPAFTPVFTRHVDSASLLPAAKCAPAGTVLMSQGLIAENVQWIRSGLVKLVHITACGRETTVGLRSEGWYGGAASVLLNTPSVFSIQAVTACNVIRIPAKHLSRLLLQNPELLGHFLEMLCLEVASQASMLVEIMSGTAEDRLDHFMRERNSVRISERTFDPMPVLKQMEIAQLLSITPEHLSRLMHKRRSNRSALQSER